MYCVVYSFAIHIRLVFEGGGFVSTILGNFSHFLDSEDPASTSWTKNHSRILAITLEIATQSDEKLNHKNHQVKMCGLS